MDHLAIKGLSFNSEKPKVIQCRAGMITEDQDIDVEKFENLGISPPSSSSDLKFFKTMIVIHSTSLVEYFVYNTAEKLIELAYDGIHYSFKGLESDLEKLRIFFFESEDTFINI